MSKLEELIQKYCPDGVEYKRLEECCEILDSKRKPVAKGMREAGEYPYYGANGIQDYVSDFIFDGTYVLVGEDGSVMTEHGNPVVNWAEGKIWVNNHAHIIEEKEGMVLRFLFHYLQTVNVRELIHGNIPKLNQRDFRNIQVPVPALPVQREIVRVLDEFTLYSAELAAELAARKTQYEFYRNKLLSFDKDVQIYSIDDICTKISSGGTPNTNNSSYYGGGIPWLRTQEVDFGPIAQTGITITEEGLKNSSAKWVAKNAVVVAMYGATVGKVGYTTIPLTTNQACCNLEIDPSIASYKYVFYWLANKYEYIKSLGQGSQTNINARVVRELKIPIPPLKIQEQIVSVIECFDSICSNRNISLSAEIEARQNQYEYYRDRLFDFKRK